MNKFTLDNTDGFSVEQLKAMNFEIEQVMSGVDADDPNYNDILKNESDRIFNKYC